jgi:hypothetical protein
MIQYSAVNGIGRISEISSFSNVNDFPGQQLAAVKACIAAIQVFQGAAKLTNPASGVKSSCEEI